MVLDRFIRQVLFSIPSTGIAVQAPKLMNPQTQPTINANGATTCRKLERVQGLSHQEFLQRYVIPRKPAILLDAISTWPALNKWGPEFWKRTYGERSVVVDGKNHRLKEIVELALNSNPERPAPYYRNIKVRNEYPELMADISPYPPHCGPNWFHSLPFFPIRDRIVGGGGHYELFIGGAGRSFPFLHFDSPGAHTFIHQIVGRKKFILFAPEDDIDRVALAPRISCLAGFLIWIGVRIRRLAHGGRWE